MTKFSIIVPVYNMEQYLNRCLDSVKNQTYKNFECIIVNDGSTDNSLNIIKEYLKDKRFVLIDKENEGVAQARNDGLSEAKGDYFLFIDSDDSFNLDALEIIAENINDEDVLRYQYQEIGRNINKIEEKPFEGTSAIPILKYKTVDVMWLYAFKRIFWEKNNFIFKKGYYHEDFDIILRILSRCQKVKSINNILYNYYLTSNSIMRTSDKVKNLKKYNDVKDLTINLLNDLEEKEYQSFVVNSFFNKLKFLDKSKYKNELFFIKQNNLVKYLDSSTLKRKLKKILLKLNFSFFYNFFY